MTTETARVASARRSLAKEGYKLEKSRVRNPHINNQGGFQIIDECNVIADGSNYELTVDQVASFVDGLRA
jgi:hypothetical protein